MFLMGAITGTIRTTTATTATTAATLTTGTTTTAAAASTTRARSTARVFALVFMIIVAAAGAIVALGDTLFPHGSLAEGLAADVNPASHFLIRLRVWHPLLAVAAAALSVWAFRSSLVTWLVLGQAGLGVMNLLMLAPLPLQMAHLLGSSLLWIAMVWQSMGTE
jgi:heme A synthase